MAASYRNPTTRKPGTTTLKQAIDDLLNAYQLRGKYNETYLVTYWEKLMGRPIASRTGKLYVKDRKLFVQIHSAPLKNELLLAKSKVIDLINREMGEAVIDDVVFI